MCCHLSYGESFVDLLESDEPGALLAAVKALARFTDPSILDKLIGKIGKSSVADEIIYQILTVHGLASIPIIIEKLTAQEISLNHGIQFLLSMITDSSATQLGTDDLALLRNAGQYILEHFKALDPDSKRNTLKTYTENNLPGAMTISQLALDDDIQSVRATAPRNSQANRSSAKNPAGADHRIIRRTFFIFSFKPSGQRSMMYARPSSPLQLLLFVLARSTGARTTPLCR